MEAKPDGLMAGIVEETWAEHRFKLQSCLFPFSALPALPRKGWVVGH